MTRLTCLAAVLLVSALCVAQDLELWEAKRALEVAKEKLEEVVVFCEGCGGTGKLEGKMCVQCDGLGVLLKPELKRIEHRRVLEDRAQRAGAPTSQYAAYDVGKRLEAFEKEIEPEGLKMLIAYVEYMRVYRRCANALTEDEEFAREIEQTVEQLDRLVDRHGRRLYLPSLKLLHEEDPTGKVGAFRLYGMKKTVRVDGKEMERLELRTLKDCSLLIVKSEAKKRKGFTLMEIVGKGTYETDDGQSINAIMLQPW